MKSLRGIAIPQTAQSLFRYKIGEGAPLNSRVFLVRWYSTTIPADLLRGKKTRIKSKEESFTISDLNLGHLVRSSRYKNRSQLSNNCREKTTKEKRPGDYQWITKDLRTSNVLLCNYVHDMEIDTLKKVDTKHRPQWRQFQDGRH